ncbi:hypothetical protein L6270_00035 [Candidatus Parcubacteria bacterium]|nr:hypothetical protein [Patescibacteria group bacterium]MBU4309543.1 hypothetical protein [Patescibacteria group bacterium]MBU4432527.1 hypothetical protein [Patescibacteria group bacterium]MBU4578069.1 hypothetical protein [Patescibacteria group bacterium]MCG2696423.1 hypothetical protein [Candidatus Parcubacteria bacterium]
MEEKFAENFHLLNMFDQLVPVDYCHATQLDNFFWSSIGKSPMFKKYKDCLTDSNFSEVSHKLVPGKTYVVKIFTIKMNHRVTSDECLRWLISQGAVFVGAQGLAFAWKAFKGKLPVDKLILSFDEKNKLWKDDEGSYRVPYLNREHDGGWAIHLGHFETSWSEINGLICFCEK